MKFDNLCMSMAAVGDALGDDEKTVILLGSLSSDYDAMVKIIENSKDVTLVDAKEMLRREFESNQKREASEIALKVSGARGGPRHARGNGRCPSGPRNAKGHGFTGKCFRCHRQGHKQAECPTNRSSGGAPRAKTEFVFSVTDQPAMSGSSTAVQAVT